MSGIISANQPPTSLRLETRKKNQIKNSLSLRPADAGMHLAVSAYKKQYPSAIHRDVGPCHTFNCHGLTFASRRCWVDDEGVTRVMQDDGYDEVAQPAVKPGDIILYIEGGNVTHSGMVVWVPQAIATVAQPPHILSKWGFCHEVVHKPFESPYFENAECKYYRVKQ